jgi:NCAIR mutase (PurE)-related protein
VDREAARELLVDLQAGRLTVGEAMERLRSLPYEDLGFASPDTHRDLRRGHPEAVYGPGKKPEQVVDIVRSLREGSRGVVVTRPEEETLAALEAAFPGEVTTYAGTRLVLVGRLPETHGGRVLVVSAGTSDQGVAEEAAASAEIAGAQVDRMYDVGVAGLHRLTDRLDALRAADILIVVAGMEGALPSVVAGLVDIPVVAVPTSVGYGATFDGLAALLGMLSSCVPGVVTVNVDNGYGAGYFAALTAGRSQAQKTP